MSVSFYTDLSVREMNSIFEKEYEKLWNDLCTAVGFSLNITNVN